MDFHDIITKNRAPTLIKMKTVYGYDGRLLRERNVAFYRAKQ